MYLHSDKTDINFVKNNERYQNLYGQESFASTLDAFINGVEAGIPLEPTLDDGMRAQLIAVASIESLQKNMPVKISYRIVININYLV